MKTTLNLPIDIYHDSNTGFTYCPDSAFESSLYAPSVNNAKNKLRPLLMQEMNDALTEHRNYQRRVIATKNGEVFVVYFRHGHWGYDIAREGQTGCSSSWGSETFDETVKRAVSHANQAFGGVLWQC